MKGLERIVDSDNVVIDVETSGLDWKTNYIVGYVITVGPNEGDTYYVPVRHRSANYLDYDPPLEETAKKFKVHPFEVDLRDALSKNPTHIIGHNLAFDLKFMYRAGVLTPTCTYEDTMINAALINEYRKSYSLENCCLDAKVTAKRGQPLYEYLAKKFGGNPSSKQMSVFWKLDGDDPIGIEYAKGDGVATWALWQQQQKDLDEQDLRKIHGIECRCIRTLHRMMVRGVKVDEERLKNVTHIINKRLDKAMEVLPDNINLRSSTQMKKLFDDNGIVDYPMTEKGNPSFAEAWLLTTELGKRVVAARKYGNLLNSFIIPMQTHLHKGRIHTDFNQSRSDQYGTVTGRLSSSRPNMQQVPKRNEELGKLFRSVFIPDKNMVWASVDYSQCEPRLLAHYAKCAVLLRGYLSDPPIDAHTAVAEAANIDRTSGKRLNQGLITGMGKDKLIQELGVERIVGEAMYDQYHANMPEIKTFQKHAARVMKRRGYVTSLLGRRAHMDYTSGKDMSYKAVNRLLQCGNADIIKNAMVEIDEYLEKNGDTVHMLLSVHDSIDFQFKEKDRYIYEGALEIMTDYGPGCSVELVVPMEVDIGEGKNWSEASYG